MIDMEFYQKYNQSQTINKNVNGLSELQENTQYELDTNYINVYDLKSGMEYFKETAVLNGTLEFNCTVDRERVKEKILNSISRKIRCRPDIGIKAGDYIKHQFHYSDEPERTYIVIAQPDPKRGFVESFMTECCFKFNMMYGDEIYNIPCYPDDNKIMLRDSSIGAIEGKDMSSTWIVVQDNVLTSRLGKTIKRIILDNDDVYEIIGVNRLPSVKGIMKVSLANTEKDPRDNFETGIAYNEHANIPDETVDSDIVGDDDIYFDLSQIYTIDNNTQHTTIWSSDMDSIVQYGVINNKSCEITLPYNNTLIGKYLTLYAMINGVKYEKKIKIFG